MEQYVQADDVEIERFCVENRQGIQLEDVIYCKIVETVSRNSTNFGIILYNTSGSQIRSSEIYSNYYDGICLDHESNNNTLSLNCIYDFQRDGIGIHTSPFNVIEANTILNGNTGLHIRYAPNNTIRVNMIADCAYGMWMEHSQGNILYHNNFVNNTIEASLPGSENNTWDNGCEGNYWSNYNGTDLDGVGDTELPWEGVEYYPLMNSYWNPGDVDHDLDVDLYDAVRVLLAYGSTPSDSNWNPHCDIAGPYGKMDLYDAVLLPVNYGKKYN